MMFKRLFVLAAACSIIFAACNSNSTTEKKVTFENPHIQGITDRIEKNPENASLYYERGHMFHRLRQDSLALDDFKKAAKLDSTKAEYYSAIGDLMFEHKDISGSISYIEKALKINPKDPAARLKMAKMFLYTKEYTRSFSEINTVLRQDVYNPEAYFLKGMVYKDMKDTTKALSSFLTAVQVDPQYRDAVLQLGLLYSKQNDPIALKYLDNAFKIDTTDAFPLYAKGVFYQDRKQYDKAKEEYANAIYHDQQYADAYFNVGYILMQQDSFEKAWRQYDMITKMILDDHEAYYNRGLCSEMMGKKADAIADYRQALVFNRNYEAPKEGLKRLGVN